MDYVIRLQFGLRLVVLRCLSALGVLDAARLHMHVGQHAEDADRGRKQQRLFRLFLTTISIFSRLLK